MTHVIPPKRLPPGCLTLLRRLDSYLGAHVRASRIFPFPWANYTVAWQDKEQKQCFDRVDEAHIAKLVSLDAIRLDGSGKDPASGEEYMRWVLAPRGLALLKAKGVIEGAELGLELFETDDYDTRVMLRETTMTRGKADG